MKHFLIAAGISALCIPSASAEAIRWARVADALTLDPHAVNQSVTHAFMHHIYETLVTVDVDGVLQPRLATRWELKPDDPNVWVFTLRSDVVFHDGAAFTADDVVFSIDRARSETSFMRQLHAGVESVVAIDDLTVEIRLTAPSPIYPNNLTNTFIMDRDWSETNDVVAVQDHTAGQENYAVRNANGTGPYVLVSRDPDVESVMALNENHWAETPPQVTEIVYLPISDNATRMAALLSGEVDFVQDVPVQDVERLASSDGIHVETGPENRFIYLGMRQGSPLLTSDDAGETSPFDNPLVREAINLAVDRDAIHEVVMRGQSVPTGIANPPFVRGWSEELDAYEPADLERAQQLLAEAGYPDGFSVTLDTPNNRYVNDEAISQAIVSMLSQIGLDVSLSSRPLAQHSPRILAGESDFFLMGWGVPTFDSQYTLAALFHSKGEDYGIYNSAGYSNLELDEIIKQVDLEIDEEARDALVDRAWHIIKEDNAYIAVHNQILAYGMRDDIRISVNPSDAPRLYELTFAN